MGRVSQSPLTHLQTLEAESIEILREVAASFERPVMMYSIGKDSSVLLHLARKAFYPAKLRSRCCTSTRPGSSAR
jgi:sulfate adenylyltransferase subunit 2